MADKMTSKSIISFITSATTEAERIKKNAQDLQIHNSADMKKANTIMGAIQRHGDKMASVVELFEPILASLDGAEKLLLTKGKLYHAKLSN